MPTWEILTLTWTTAGFTRSAMSAKVDGASGEAFLPALYPGTHGHKDDAVRLARAHDWQGGDGTPTLGFGPRLYLVGDDGIPLLEFRELALDEPPAKSPEGA